LVRAQIYNGIEDLRALQGVKPEFRTANDFLIDWSKALDDEKDTAAAKATATTIPTATLNKLAGVKKR
jgi:hypothetical protein